ncbi:hypothetical protein N7462_002303 [Penicillium macrosclerotiorum]|uniref:uncharacterized protein n=1 Tax=Penicillium macrosclerotiorum TaxID=303699 RepID=UPI0025489D29|nr:uncharacterized protein N7462_002303 [Penicillium macrosclerotiorum]KAJ5692880.1 hypothetical protein N7462_002303 [Penicillium macrosclerotiorum]
MLMPVMLDAVWPVDRLRREGRWLDNCNAARRYDSTTIWEGKQHQQSITINAQGNSRTANFAVIRSAEENPPKGVGQSRAGALSISDQKVSGRDAGGNTGLAGSQLLDWAVSVRLIDSLSRLHQDDPPGYTIAA